MLSYTELKPIVEGIARQYSKDLVMGTGFSYQKYQDLSQDLWVKAYEIISNYPEAPAGYMAKCLWNYVTDLFRKDMNKVSNETLVDNNEFSASQVSEIFNKDLLIAIVENSDKYDSFEDYHISELVSMVLQVAKSCHPDMYKYVVIKLKLSGLIDNDFEPEYDISSFVKSRKDVDYLQDQFILKDLFGFSDKCSKTGGSGSFKSKKSNLRNTIIRLLNVEESYMTYYEITYVDENGNFNSKWIKAYSKDKALEAFKNKFPSCKVSKIEGDC